jgi:hypothetical protein
MNKNTMYETQPAVSELNKVQGFNPMNFMRKTISKATKQEILYLDLKFKKLWFRLAHPKGHIKKNALTITEQIAVIEAKIFLDINDKEPVASFIAQKNSNGKTGASYIQDAQYAAENQALIDAGFGLQFCDVSQGVDSEIYDMGIPVSTASAEPKAKIIETAPAEASQTETPVITEPPAAEAPAVTAQQDEIIAEQPIDSTDEQQTAETGAPEIVEQSEPAEFETVQTQNDITPYLSYTADMPVDEILKVMTLAEAGTISVDVGTCKGWMMSDVMEKRPASLKWYMNGYTGGNNILRAAAKMMIDYMAAKKAA